MIHHNFIWNWLWRLRFRFRTDWGLLNPYCNAPVWAPGWPEFQNVTASDSGRKDFKTVRIKPVGNTIKVVAHRLLILHALHGIQWSGYVDAEVVAIIFNKIWIMKAQDLGGQNDISTLRFGISVVGKKLTKSDFTDGFRQQAQLNSVLEFLFTYSNTWYDDTRLEEDWLREREEEDWAWFDSSLGFCFLYVVIFAPCYMKTQYQRLLYSFLQLQ